MSIDGESKHRVFRKWQVALLQKEDNINNRQKKPSEKEPTVGYPKEVKPVSEFTKGGPMGESYKLLSALSKTHQHEEPAL